MGPCRPLANGPVSESCRRLWVGPGPGGNPFYPGMNFVCCTNWPGTWDPGRGRTPPIHLSTASGAGQLPVIRGREKGGNRPFRRTRIPVRVRPTAGDFSSGGKRRCFGKGSDRQYRSSGHKRDKRRGLISTSPWIDSPSSRGAKVVTKHTDGQVIMAWDDAL